MKMYNAKEFFYSMLSEEEKSEVVVLDTLDALLKQGVEKYADDQAVNDYTSALTYKELEQEVGRIRGYLKKLGFEKGMKAGLFFRNDAAFVKMFFAVTTLGGVVTPFPVQLPQPALFGSLKKFEASFLFYADEFEGVCAGAPVKAVKFSDVEPAGYAPAEKLTKDDDAAIFFTGGTTGRPKGALLTHGAIMRGSYNGCFIPRGILRERYIAMIPYSHVFGVIRNLLSCLQTGSVMYSCADMKKLFEYFAQARPSILVLVPGLADMLLGISTLKGIGALGGNLKTIISGAAPVPPSLIERWAQYGVELYPGYGLTESANLVSGSIANHTHPDSVGNVFEAIETKIVDGELWLKGPNMFKCYYNDPEETAKAFSEDGWFKTGDLARFDDEDRLYIVGRIKNLIILPNGENVSPEELEGLLYKQPIVKDCLVKEMKNDLGVAMIGVEVLPNMPAAQKMGITDVPAAVNAAVDKVNEALPTYMRIAKVVVRDKDFDRNPAMQIIRK